MDLHRRFADKGFNQDHSLDMGVEGIAPEKNNAEVTTLGCMERNGVPPGQSRKTEFNTLPETVVARTGSMGVKVLIASTLHGIASRKCMFA
jgi:hypothetical protein